MTQSEIKLSTHPRTGVTRMRAGMVETLAIDNAKDNGALTLKLDFADATIPSVDFKMNPPQGLTAFDLLAQPHDDLWSALPLKDMPPARADRKAIACGGLEKLAIVVDGKTAIATFTAEFARGAAIPAVEFSFDGQTATQLIRAITVSAEEFGWIEMLQAVNAAAPEGNARH